MGMQGRAGDSVVVVGGVGWLGGGPGHGLAFQVVWCSGFVVPNVVICYVGNGFCGHAKYGL